VIERLKVSLIVSDEDEGKDEDEDEENMSEWVARWMRYFRLERHLKKTCFVPFSSMREWMCQNDGFWNNQKEEGHFSGDVNPMY
jgi:hypothetical protein